MSSEKKDSSMPYQVLIVEDHTAIRAIYRQFIARESALEVCGEAATGAEALNLLAQIVPDVIVLDISLPDINGITLLKRLKERYPNLPVLVVSGENEHIYGARTMQAGASRYLDKNQVADTLVPTILTVARDVLNGG